MKNLRRHYPGTGILRNLEFSAGDVSRETLCQRLLLVEYFELKMKPRVTIS